MPGSGIPPVRIRHMKMKKEPAGIQFLELDDRARGVFATRAPSRPNPIGLSALALLGIDSDGSQVALRLGGVDLADGTPVAAIEDRLLATAFHPELTNDTRFHQYFLSLIRPSPS